MSRTLLPTELLSHIYKFYLVINFLLDLSGMSRALSPAELPCHVFLYVSVAGSSAALTKIYNFAHYRSLRELPCHVFLYVSVAGSSAALTKIYNFAHYRSLRELPCHKFKLFTCHLSILSQTFLNFK